MAESPLENAALTRTLVLVRDAQGGDKEALNRLLERYYERVRRIVRLRLGPKIRSKIESGDILQDTFMKAVEIFDKFQIQNEASFINWLSKIAEHKIHDAVDKLGAKKRDMSKEVSLQIQRPDASGPITMDPPSDELPPLQELTKLEAMKRVEDAVDRLDPQYKELVILRDYAGLPWEDIAAETGRPSGAAARMMHAKALIELGKLVESGGDEAAGS